MERGGEEGWASSPPRARAHDRHEITPFTALLDVRIRRAYLAGVAALEQRCGGDWRGAEVRQTSRFYPKMLKTCFSPKTGIIPNLSSISLFTFFFSRSKKNVEKRENTPPVARAPCRPPWGRSRVARWCASTSRTSLTQQTVTECVLWAPQAVSGAAKQFFCMRSACKRPDLSPAVT